MKVMFVVFSLFLSVPSFAKSMICDQVIENGVLLAGLRSRVVPDEALLSTTKMVMISKTTVYPLNTPAVWFVRDEECKITKKPTADGSVSFAISCKSIQDVGLEAELNIASDRKSASYVGDILVTQGPTMHFDARLGNCQDGI